MESITYTDKTYADVLNEILTHGVPVQTRNANCLTYPCKSVVLNEYPLITVRKTAQKMALQEMEWFLSGQDLCPPALLPWWQKQLTSDNRYLHGYAHQLRKYSGTFDQVAHIINSLKEHPKSRRIVATTWNPKEMANITETNKNNNTPTCCHGTLYQFFTMGDYLHMYTYQRSADIMLGVPHNWVQTYAFLTYIAHHTGFVPANIYWQFGDLHMYEHSSHIETAKRFVEKSGELKAGSKFKLEYNYSGEESVVVMDDGSFSSIPKFKVSDFTLPKAPEPLVTSKPKLFE